MRGSGALRGVVSMGCALALGASASVPARALPGQTIAAFKAWSAGKILIKNVEQKKAEMSGLPYWTTTNADHGISWTFTANTDGTKVTDEALGVSTTTADPGATPINHDGTGYGFMFFKSLYGAAIAADFHASQKVASIPDRGDPKKPAFTTFWRGKLYGYRASSDGGFLSVYALGPFGKELALEQRCAAHPNECNE